MFGEIGSIKKIHPSWAHIVNTTYCKFNSKFQNMNETIMKKGR